MCVGFEQIIVLLCSFVYVSLVKLVCFCRFSGKGRIIYFTNWSFPVKAVTLNGRIKIDANNGMLDNVFLT